MRLVAPSRSRNSSGVSHARRRTISSSIMAMCAAGPPNDVAPRRRNNSASSESVVRRPLSVIPRSNASESTDDGRRTTENFYQLDLPRVVHVVRGEAVHVLCVGPARAPAPRAEPLGREPGDRRAQQPVLFLEQGRVAPPGGRVGLWRERRPVASGARESQPRIACQPPANDVLPVSRVQHDLPDVVTPTARTP